MIAQSSGGGSGGLGVLVVIVIVGSLYFLPTIVASSRHHHNVGSVAVINFFLGWTFIGWVVALSMAASGTKATRR